MTDDGQAREVSVTRKEPDVRVADASVALMVDGNPADVTTPDLMWLCATPSLSQLLLCTSYGGP